MMVQLVLSLTFEEYVNSISKHDYIQAKFYESESYREDFVGSLALPDPILTINAMYQPQWFSITQAFPLGKLYEPSRTSQMYQAKRYEYTLYRNVLIYQAISTYIDAVHASIRIRILEDILENTLRIKEILESNLIHFTKRASYEILRIESRISMLEGKLVQAKQELSSLMHRLSFFYGDSVWEVDTSLPSIDTQFIYEPEGTPIAKVKEHTYRSMDAMENQSFLNLLPSPTLSLLRRADGTFGFFVGLQIPIYFWKNLSNYRKSRKLRERSYREYVATLRDVRSELMRLSDSFRAYWNNYLSLRRSVEELEVALKDYISVYRNEPSDLTTYLQMENQLLENKLSMYANYYQAYKVLYRIKSIRGEL